MARTYFVCHDEGAKMVQTGISETFLIAEYTSSPQDLEHEKNVFFALFFEIVMKEKVRCHSS